MKTYARVENSIVVELFDTSGDIFKMFHPDMIWVECSGSKCDVGWEYSGGTFLKPNALDPVKTIAKKWEAIKADRDRRSESGGYKVGAKWFHSDQKSRIQQQDNEAAGNALEPVEWKTMDGSLVTMTPSLAIKIRAARMASDRAIFAAAEAHRAAMEASADPAVYDYSTGWPETYQDAGK